MIRQVVTNLGEKIEYFMSECGDGLIGWVKYREHVPHSRYARLPSDTVGRLWWPVRFPTRKAAEKGLTEIEVEYGESWDGKREVVRR